MGSACCALMTPIQKPRSRSILITFRTLCLGWAGPPARYNPPPPRSLPNQTAKPPHHLAFVCLPPFSPLSFFAPPHPHTSCLLFLLPPFLSPSILSHTLSMILPLPPPFNPASLLPASENHTDRLVLGPHECGLPIACISHCLGVLITSPFLH